MSVLSFVTLINDLQMYCEEERSIFMATECFFKALMLSETRTRLYVMQSNLLSNMNW